MQNMTSLFLSQSYKDAWDDYQRTLTQENYPCWDYIVLTASNEQQAEGLRIQLAQREDAGFLPSHTHFVVIPDPDGKRVGSGGATLSVLRYLAEETGKSDFAGMRTLVIHSGGDSKRVPQYSAMGKLFSPVPHELPDGRVSTLFDEFMIGMSSVASRIREGMLLLSGDVLLLFNALQIDAPSDGAAAISFKEDVHTGKEHGVFLYGSDGNVKRFLHKQTVEALRAYGAVNQHDCVDIDTGAIVFAPKMLAALYQLISRNGIVDEEAFERYVNDRVRLSLYGDFLYPLATDSTLEEFYREKAEGELCPELMAARKVLWGTLRPFRMKLLRLAPAKFIHFGTTREILRLMSEQIDDYTYLGWEKHVNSSISRKDVAGYNSVLSGHAQCGRGTYLEVSYVHHGAKIGRNSVLSYVDIHDECVPDNVVLHGLKQCDGRFVVRIYSVDDDPKKILEAESTFLGQPFESFLANNGIGAEEIWDGSSRMLWEAKLYPVCATITEAIAAALNLYALMHGHGNLQAWRACERKSLQAGFQDADPNALIAWDKRMRELVRMDRVAKLIENQVPACQAQAMLQTASLTPIQRGWLEKQLQRSDLGISMRLNYYIGTALGGADGDKYIAAAFKCIQSAVLNGSREKLHFNENCRITRDYHSVRLPLRVNWGGGWSDTPPYCNERGGTVLNAAILLNGKMPVEVTLKRLDEHKIVFDSQDMDVHGEFTQMEALQNTGDPYDPFALQKAVLLSCGILPSEGGNLDEILTRLGGGFHMQSEVRGVPKGSGLGTSSILAGACVKAIFEFMGIAHTDSDIYSHVLCVEQIMSTGGGWQDQVGGLSNGIKYCTSMPGLQQEIRVQRVDIPDTAMRELDDRFCLIYTGQRRLARNLLRDVVGRYIGNELESLYALNEIQRVAALMRFELERGNVDAFAELLTKHWELSQKVDAGSTNTLIDQIFATIDDLIDGRMICGAGGGGFLQVILKKGITKENVHNRLKKVFQDNDIDVWDCSLG